MEKNDDDGAARRRPALPSEAPGTGGSRTEAATSIRLAASLLFAGVVLSLAAGILHPEGASANDHVASFTEYAASDLWIGVHLGQFGGMAVLIAGLFVLGSTLDGVPGQTPWTARLGTLAAAAALALYGGLQAVDGVALKHSVDAWSAQAVRTRG